MTPNVVLPNRRTTLNDQIDDIFSELTEEVYPPQRRSSPGPPLRPPTAVAAKNDTTRSVKLQKHVPSIKMPMIVGDLDWPIPP